MGIDVECDPRHVDLVIAELGLGSARGIDTPGTKEPAKNEDDELLTEASEVTSPRLPRGEVCHQRGADIATDVGTEAK